MNNIGKMGILILESDSVMRSVLRDILSPLGCVVRIAKDIGVAVRKIHEVEPDLLIVSPYLDGVSGDEAATFLRKDGPGMDILMVAGFPHDDRIENRMLNHGIHSFPPPYPKEALLQKVRELLTARDAAKTE